MFRSTVRLADQAYWLTMAGKRVSYTVRLDEDTLTALYALARAECRSGAKQVEYLITTEATRRGLWIRGSKPALVASKDGK